MTETIEARRKDWAGLREAMQAFVKTVARFTQRPESSPASYHPGAGDNPGAELSRWEEAVRASEFDLGGKLQALENAWAKTDQDLQQLLRGMCLFRETALEMPWTPEPSDEAQLSLIHAQLLNIAALWAQQSRRERKLQIEKAWLAKTWVWARDISLPALAARTRDSRLEPSVALLRMRMARMERLFLELEANPAGLDERMMGFVGAEIARLRSRYKGLDQENARLRREHEQWLPEAKALRSEMDSVRRDNDILARHNERYRALLEEAKADREAALIRLRDAEAALREERAAMQSRLIEKDAMLVMEKRVFEARLSEKESALQNERRVFEAERNTLRQRFKEAIFRLRARFKQEASAGSSEIEQLRKEKELWQGAKALLLEGFEEERQSMQKEIARLQNASAPAKPEGPFWARFLEERRSDLDKALREIDALGRSGVQEALRARLRALAGTLAQAQDLLRTAAMFHDDSPSAGSPGSVSSLLEKSLRPWETSLRLRAVALQRKIEQKLPDCLISEPVAIVFYQILRNAYEAMPRGGSLRVEAQAGPEGRTLVRFIDTGPGLPAELVGKRPAPGFAARSGHPGLGLALAQRIMDRLGGQLQLSNEQPNGACVALLFNPADAAPPPSP